MYIHAAKFDSAVQGTLLQNYATEPESYDTTASTAISEAISDDQTTVNESVTNSSTSIVSISTSVVTSGLLLYAILGAAGGILILLIIIPILCGIVYCLATGKSCTTSTAAQVEIVIHGEYGIVCSITMLTFSTAIDQNAQEEGFICLGNFLNSNFDRIVVIDETGKCYVGILECTHTYTHIIFICRVRVCTH